LRLLALSNFRLAVSVREESLPLLIHLINFVWLNSGGRLLSLSDQLSVALLVDNLGLCLKHALELFLVTSEPLLQLIDVLLTRF
jgi:hypothetical protein